MKLQEITAEQYLAILQMGGDAVCTEDEAEPAARDYFLRCVCLDKAYSPSLWEGWARRGCYKYFYTVVE